MNIYVASSYKNKLQPEIVLLLQNLGHEVYDFFKNPHSFDWKNINKDQSDHWEPEVFANELKNNSIVEDAFVLDYSAVNKADCCLMILPCGKSAHIEAGWFKGKGKSVYVLMLEKNEPELMYKFFDEIITSKEQLKNIFSF